MPKAAIIKHSRYLFASYCLFCMGLTYDDDILYSVLPMYHSAAHVCLGVTITEGNTAVTRKKFSATKFWEDCVKNNVTVCVITFSIKNFICVMLNYPHFIFSVPNILEKLLVIYTPLQSPAMRRNTVLE